MERIHPNLSSTATRAMIALALGLSGCRSSSSGIAGSPFMSPDRVPPPNTRMLAPGQAQPYYQGDPLPPMQSAANRPAPAIAALPTDAETRTASGRTLSWAQPGAAAPSANPTGPAPAAVVSVPQPPAQPQTVVAASEASVAVPNDGDPLRFPLPTPQVSERPAPIASAALAPTPSPVQPVAAQPQPSVLQASYNAPIPSAPPLPVNQPTMNPPQQVVSPWRSPQIAQAASAPTFAPQSSAIQPNGTAPMVLPAPPAIPPNTMAATLRAVESPAQPGDPMPRVRMPGYVASQTGADGFRPRTSMQ
jgi:hypothetical protein